MLNGWFMTLLFFAFTAPVAELTVVSFTVPFYGWTIVATATVVTSHSSLGDCPAAGVHASRCRVVVVLFLVVLMDSVWDSVKPQTGKLFFIYFQYQEVVRCVCMLNGWFCNFDDICADNYNFSRFKLKDKCRSEQWEVICAVT